MQTVIQELIKKHDEIVAEKKQSDKEFERRMNEICDAIETLSGKNIWDLKAEQQYDDENPNYIKGSFEEI
jgi:hypothetical protein